MQSSILHAAAGDVKGDLAFQASADHSSLDWVTQGDLVSWLEANWDNSNKATIPFDEDLGGDSRDALVMGFATSGDRWVEFRDEG